MVKAAAAKGPTPEEREATRELLAKAKDLIKAVDNSDFCKEHSVSRHYPVFDHTEIATGPVLGFGGFGVVYEVEEFILKDSGSNDTATLEHLEVPEDDLPVFETDKAGAASDSGEVQDDTLEHAHYEVSTARKFMVANVRRHGVDARYAIKCLREDLSALHRARGMIDMVIETKLLSRLWHPNIGTQYSICAWGIHAVGRNAISKLRSLQAFLVPCFRIDCSQDERLLDRTNVSCRLLFCHGSLVRNLGPENSAVE